MDKLEVQPGSLVSFDLASDGERHATVRIAGELDMSGIDPLATQVEEVLATGIDRLTVDVGQVRFADSSAIALWVRWAGAVSEFELREPAPLLLRVITAMGLSDKLGVAA
jgi:anti-anti-sigma factor